MSEYGSPGAGGGLGCWKSPVGGEAGKAQGGQDWGCVPGEDSFSHGPSFCPAGSRYLRQECEVSVQNEAVGMVEELQEVVGHEVERIGHGQRRKEFLLLSLVI